MYMITKMIDGRWCGIYQIQDGTDRFEVNTRKGAVDRMIRAVKIMNHLDITENDMEFGREEASTDVRCVSMIVSNEVFSNIVNGVMRAIKFGSDDCDLHLNFFKDIVTDVCNFRKTLERISIMEHADDCAWKTGYCHCPVEVALEALKEDE